jgi:hypothetical protein
MAKVLEVDSSVKEPVRAGQYTSHGTHRGPLRLLQGQFELVASA